MFRLVFLSVALAASAQAQIGGRPMTVGSYEPGGERVLLTISGVAGGAGAAALTHRLASAGLQDGGSAAVLAFVAYPIGLGLSEWAVGRALGLSASGVDVAGRAALGTAVGVAIGALVGLGTGALTYAIIGIDGEYDFSGVIVGLVVGTATAAVVPAVFVSRSFEASPVVLRAPTGESAPGMGLRFTF